MLMDLRDALRGLRKSLGLSSVAVATLAVGIGANTALFSVVNAVLLRPLSFYEPDRIASIGMNLRHGEIGNQAPVQDYQAWTRDSRVFAALAAFNAEYGNIGGGKADAEWLAGAKVTRGFFSVLGVLPTVGRPFTADEDRVGSRSVAIISDAMWHRRFSADPTIVGKPIVIEGRQYQVVGVMPPGFRFPDDADFWMPSALADESPAAMSIQYVRVIGRIRLHSTLKQAQLEMTTLSRRLDPLRSAEWLRGADVEVVTLHDRLYAGQRPILTLLLTVVGIVYLIACGNVAGLLMARASGRRRELGTRLALGASPGRLARLLLIEGFLLASAGAAVGSLLAVGGVRALLQLAPEVTAGLKVIPMDWLVLCFGLVVSLLTGFLCGLGPAVMASKVSLYRMATFGNEHAGPRSVKNTPRQILVAMEFAAALILLTGASLFLRSFARVASVDLGFRTANVLTVQISLPELKYPPNSPTRRDFFERLVAITRSIPGVQAATIATAGPFQRTSRSVRLELGGTVQPLELVRTVVDQDYFRVLRIPVLGRAFNANDRVGTPVVAIINRTAARTLFQGNEPLGRTIPAEIGEGQSIVVVGVVSDVRQQGVHRAAAAQIYLPLAQVSGIPSNLLVLGNGDPKLLIEPLRHAVLGLDPLQALTSARPLEDVVAEQIASERTISLLVAVFAAVALWLAVVGLYGLMAFVVGLRVREIAIRMALGADRTGVMGLVVGQAMKLALTGIFAGIIASLALSRLMKGLLSNVSPLDTLSYVVAAVILGGASLTASYSLARRAARIEPVVNLRTSG